MSQYKDSECDYNEELDEYEQQLQNHVQQLYKEVEKESCFKNLTNQLIIKR